MSLGAFLLMVLGFNTLALGNGPVMIPLFRRGLVEERVVLGTDQLLYAFAIAQVTPGQNNVYVASLGYMVHGLAGGLLAILVMVLPGYTMLLLLRGYESLRNAPRVRRFSRGLTAASVGLDLCRHGATRPRRSACAPELGGVSADADPDLQAEVEATAQPGGGQRPGHPASGVRLKAIIEARSASKGIAARMPARELVVASSLTPDLSERDRQPS